MQREEILDTAKRCVCGDRNNDYGTPEDNFNRIAKLWTAYKGIKFSSKDVSIMMILLKIARSCNSDKDDNFIDIAGYAACGGEIVSSDHPFFDMDSDMYTE